MCAEVRDSRGSCASIELVYSEVIEYIGACVFAI